MSTDSSQWELQKNDDNPKLLFEGKVVKNENFSNFNFIQKDFESTISEKHSQQFLNKRFILLKSVLTKHLTSNFLHSENGVSITTQRYSNPVIWKKNAWLYFIRSGTYDPIKLKKDDPNPSKDSIQFQVVLDEKNAMREEIKIGIWLDGISNKTRIHALEKIKNDKNTFLNLLNKIPSNYFIVYSNPKLSKEEEEILKINDQTIETIIAMLSKPKAELWIGDYLSKETAIKLDFDVVDKILDIFEKLIPLAEFLGMTNQQTGDYYLITSGSKKYDDVESKKYVFTQGRSGTKRFVAGTNVIVQKEIDNQYYFIGHGKIKDISVKPNILKDNKTITECTANYSQYQNFSERKIRTEHIFKELQEKAFPSGIPNSQFPAILRINSYLYGKIMEKDLSQENEKLETMQSTKFQTLIDENKERQIRKYKKVLDQSKGQIIFYGPPGTGKTYIAKQLANHITKVDLDGWKASTHRKIVQFHPSYSYEDFVQGIKPVKDNKGGINYILQPGIFQKFCALTFLNEDSEIKSPKTLPQCCSFVLLKELEHGGNGLSAGEIFDRVKNGHEKHDYGQLFEFSGKEKWQEGVLRHRLFDFKDTIFVHPDKNIWQINSKHEDFEKLQSKFTNEGKISLDKSPKVLIIDEINRGNLSKIFGELIYALEYRGEEIDLQYKEFSEANDYGTLTIPPKDQLMIVGTMNTADRSIILFDAALRRRFSFIPLSPDYDLLAQSLDIDKKFDETKFQTRLNELKGEDKNGKNKILSILALHKINLKLSENLSVGKEKQIGHTFLLEMQSHPENFTKVWAQDILPLLEEYYFESPETIEEWFTPDVYSKQKGIMDFDDETLEKSLKALSDSSSSE